MVGDEPFQFGYFFKKGLSDALFLCVDHCSKFDDERRPVISFDLRNEAEIDEAVDALIEELEITRRAAKAAFKRPGR